MGTAFTLEKAAMAGGFRVALAASFHCDHILYGIFWNAAQSVLASVFKNQFDRIRQALQAFFSCSPLPIRCWYFRTVCDETISVAFDYCSELIMHGEPSLTLTPGIVPAQPPTLRVSRFIPVAVANRSAGFRLRLQVSPRTGRGWCGVRRRGPGRRRRCRSGLRGSLLWP